LGKWHFCWESISNTINSRDRYVPLLPFVGSKYSFRSPAQRCFSLLSCTITQIPNELTLSKAFGHLELSYNQLTGTIPSELGRPNSKMWLFRINNNQFTGPIPSELGDLSMLHSLRLQDNQLTSTLPKELSLLTVLLQLRVDGNQITGAIPSELGLWGANTTELNFEERMIQKFGESNIDA